MLVSKTDRSVHQIVDTPRAGTSAPLYALTAELFRTLGHPARIRILDVLAGGERSVRQLLPCIGLEASTLSQHLGVLRRAAVVVGRRDGHTMVYAVASSELGDMVGLARQVLAGTLAGRVDLLEDLDKESETVLAAAPGSGIERATLGEDR